MTDGLVADRPRLPLDREQQAHLEVGNTTISRRLAMTMTGLFLVTIAALPLIEGGGRLAGGMPAPAGTQGGPPPGGAPDDSAWRRIVEVNRAVLARLDAFETRLEDESVIGRALRPPTQAALSRWLGAGNERVYVGRDGWLFYRPDVEYVTSRGFLDPREHARRSAAGSEYETPPQPDPRPAILQFHRELASRGITLIVMPTPVKPSVHPNRLAWSAGDGALQNASYDAFLAELQRNGVLVFAPTNLADAGGYLVTDTHWRPETMQHAAEGLVSFLRERVSLPVHAPAGYRAERREARQAGDTAAMLDLPEGQTLYPPERVTLRFIVDVDGEPWRASREADVLMLGDSFTNIYSPSTMGWGEAAGLAEQVSYTLQRPIDRIVQNDQGAHATRGLLARDPERLAGKRVVIWQFAARELAFGDWRLLALP